MKLKLFGLFLLIFLFGIVYSQNINSEAIITFSMPRSFDVYKDVENNFVVTVKNDGSIPLNNFIISITGIPENSYYIEPNSLDKLDSGQSSHFSVSIYSENIIPGIYDVNVTMKSDETSETVTVTLNVKGYSKEMGDKINKIEEAEPALEATRSTLISIMILSGAILITTFIRLFLKGLYSSKEKG